MIFVSMMDPGPVISKLVHLLHPTSQRKYSSKEDHSLGDNTGVSVVKQPFDFHFARRTEIRSAVVTLDFFYTVFSLCSLLTIRFVRRIEI